MGGSGSPSPSASVSPNHRHPRRSPRTSSGFRDDQPRPSKAILGVAARRQASAQERAMLIQSSIRVLFVSAVLASPSLAQVRIAERPLVGPFTTLQSAVDAALEGESLIVAPGPYASFTIDGKSVHVVVTGSGHATITGKVTVKNLGATQRVLLSGLDVTGSWTAYSGQPALEILSAGGNVRVERSDFEGSETFPSPGAKVTSSFAVVFSDCTIEGGYTDAYLAGEAPIHGAP